MVLAAAKQEADRAGALPATVPAPKSHAPGPAWPWLAGAGAAILLTILFAARLVAAQRT